MSRTQPGLSQTFCEEKGGVRRNIGFGILRSKIWIKEVSERCRFREIHVMNDGIGLHGCGALHLS